MSEKNAEMWFLGPKQGYIQQTYIKKDYIRCQKGKNCTKSQKGT